MTPNENTAIKARIERIRRLSSDDQGSTDWFEAASLAQTVLHDTLGGAHPLMAALDHALKSADWSRALAASRGVLELYDEGALKSPRLMIAHEIEGDFLDIGENIWGRSLVI